MQVAKDHTRSIQLRRSTHVRCFGPIGIKRRVARSAQRRPCVVPYASSAAISSLEDWECDPQGTEPVTPKEIASELKPGFFGAFQRYTHYTPRKQRSFAENGILKLDAYLCISRASASNDDWGSQPSVPAKWWCCRFWKAYNKLLDEKPVFVKSMTSLVGFALGDCLAQVIAGGQYNLLRTLRMTLFGILMDGPVGTVIAPPVSSPPKPRALRRRC